MGGEHVGFLGIVWADAYYAYDPGTGRMQVAAYIPTFGSLENPTATVFLTRDFSVPSTLGDRVEAQVSGNVNWVGVLAGNGVAGAGADIEISLKLLEGTRVITQTTVHTKEVRESSLTIGGTGDTASASPSLSATLLTGRTYTLRLEATCNAYTGVISASTHCMYSDNDLYTDGYIRWGGFQVLLLP